MSFGEAIQDGFRKYAQFSGRSSRSAYWFWVLFVVILYVVAFILDAAAKTVIPLLIVWLAVLVPSLAVLFRRLHDTGRSGWWWLISFVPFGSIVLIVFACLESTGPNQYGDRPDVSPTTAPAY
jgi:uncharacterized membrane protein YhaH (DUF805 family)